LAKLRECLVKALEGERQIVFVTGEPGIGKTALADEFQHEAASAVKSLRIARGQCIEGYGGKEAYYPMLEALGQLSHGLDAESVIQILATQAPTWLVQLPALIKREQRENLQREILGATRERMLREIGDALEAMSSANPLLFVFEDLQWVDYSTVDLISALARRRTPAQLMLIVTKHPLDIVLPEHPLKTVKEDLLIHHLCQEIVLEPLGEMEIVEYLAAGAPQASLPEGLAELLYHNTEGNPLFMAAALEHMTERGLISQELGAWKLRVPLREIALEVPRKLRRLIEAQIERLTREEQRTLEVASVEGVAFSARVSAAAANLDAEVFEELCQQLSRRHKIVRAAGVQQFPDGHISSRYEFEHALYREVLYRRQAPAQTAKLHRSIGQSLELLFASHPVEAAAEMAHHFEQGHDWIHAIKYLRLEAENAKLRCSHREASVILNHALELVNQLAVPQRAEYEIAILQDLAQIYNASNDPRALKTYETLAEQAAECGLLDVEVRAHIDMTLPLSLRSSEQYLEALQRAMLLSVRQHDPHKRLWTRANCLVKRMAVQGWNASDEQAFHEAIHEIRAFTDPPALAPLLITYSYIQLICSEYREARRTAADSMVTILGANGGNPYLIDALQLARVVITESLFFLGEWGETLRESEAISELMKKNEDDALAQIWRLQRARICLHTMDFASARAICESLLDFVGDAAASPAGRFLLVLLGAAETALGNYDQSLAHLSVVREGMNRQPLPVDMILRMPLESALTELWLATKTLPQSRRQAESFLKAALATAERTWQGLAWEANVRVALTQGDMGKSQQCLAEAVATIKGFEVPLAAWRVHATAAEVYELARNKEVAEHHRQLSRVTILRLANSLGPEPLRRTFLSAAPVRKVIGNELIEDIRINH
jgi:hypothetical protein